MLKLKNLTFVLWGTLLFLGGCTKEEQAVAPTIANESLTTVILKATNTADAADTTSCRYKFTFDSQGNVTSSDSTPLNLKANATYAVAVQLYDELQSPVFDVSAEIKERQNYHLFFFQPTPISPANLVTGLTSPYIPGTATSATGPYLNLSVARTDHDTNNPAYELGLADKFTTGEASSGNLEVVLRHQPNAKNGTYAPGSTDLDVSYKVIIK
ncbi:hypothetical protein [Dyadobacter frigoris]|uniref:Uncharacterized protein n=1 Tax=Dyadobacter frigoris TaxID=2576211 RepID=A0A4U6CY57_9BACT|nr:hypothetical protein [Dyadobacter frigoris]TKT88785.1 hypothetical protein FDK13_26155 [Dyadobacter frigoris]GLU53982.1 hypothetical protein Dfri01_34430 [Dyadobacter frigoris]